MKGAQRSVRLLFEDRKVDPLFVAQTLDKALGLIAQLFFRLLRPRLELIAEAIKVAESRTSTRGLLGLVDHLVESLFDDGLEGLLDSRFFSDRTSVQLLHVGSLVWEGKAKAIRSTRSPNEKEKEKEKEKERDGKPFDIVAEQIVASLRKDGECKHHPASRHQGC